MVEKQLKQATQPVQPLDPPKLELEPIVEQHLNPLAITSVDPMVLAITILQEVTMVKASITAAVESSLNQVGLEILKRIGVEFALATSTLNHISST